MSSNREVPSLSAEKNDDSSEYSEDCLLNSKVEELHQALQRFKQFFTQISEEKAELFESEIIAYSNKELVLARSPEQILKLCEKRIQKMLRNKKTKKNWNQNDIDILVWVLNKYTASYAKKSVHSLQEADWKFVSSLIPATSWKKCMFKWLSLKKFSLMTFKWSKQESELLASLVKQFGKKNWKRLSEQLYISNKSSERVFRTPKQCRQHWNCYANPAIKKGPWSAKQDIKLLESILELNCMKKWSEVAKNIKGRTQNAVKNRFSLLLEKQKRETGDENEKHLINKILFNLMNEDLPHFQADMKSEDLGQIQAPNQIFESQSEDNADIDQNGLQKHTPGMKEEEKKEGKSLRNIVIPTFVQNQPVYQPSQYFSMCPDFTPYFFNFVYGSHYQMN